MKTKKLSLTELSVTSFVTEVSKSVKGGAATDTCGNTFDYCNVPTLPLNDCNVPSYNYCPTVPVETCPVALPTTPQCEIHVGTRLC